MGTAKRCFCALTMSLVVVILWPSSEVRAGWTHSVGCGDGCVDGHNTTACVCLADKSDCREVECCYGERVYLAADNLDSSDWSCGGEAVGLSTICPCGHASTYYTTEWDQYACGPCGSRQWQDCVRDGRIYIVGLVPCHQWVDPGWCRSETGSLDPCTPAGQASSTLSACQ